MGSLRVEKERSTLETRYIKGPMNKQNVLYHWVEECVRYTEEIVIKMFVKSRFYCSGYAV